MPTDKDGTATERAGYALMKALRDLIVAGGVGAVLLWLGDNEVIAGGSAIAALGVWRTIRPIVLARLPGA